MVAVDKEDFKEVFNLGSDSTFHENKVTLAKAVERMPTQKPKIQIICIIKLLGAQENNN